MPRPYVIDLFAGAGGFSLGAYLAGFRTAVAVELDQDLAYSFEANFPRTPLLVSDLMHTRAEEILDQACCPADEIAGLIGGPPCQGFSVIGRREPADPRNGLVQHFFRLVLEISPSFFVMENVPGILSSVHDSFLRKQLRRISRLYTLAGPIILDAVDFGAATRRSRAIIIGIMKTVGSEIKEGELRGTSDSLLTVGGALAALPSMNAASAEADGEFWAPYPDDLDLDSVHSFVQWAVSPPPPLLGSRETRGRCRRKLVSGFQPTEHSEGVRLRFAKVSPGGVDEISRYPRLRWDSPAPTLRAGTGRDRGSYQAARPIHPDEDRVITVREAARIQGFPDWFRFHPTKWHSFRMIGNSVSPLLAQSILKKVRHKVRHLR